MHLFQCVSVSSGQTFVVLILKCMFVLVSEKSVHIFPSIHMICLFK